MQLQGMGEFVLDNFYENPFENEKGRVRLPGNTIQFSPDKKAKEDTGLIEFISQRTGKIRPLASSDLEDFLNIGKQLLNVSKQFYIEGLGTLILNDSSNYDFIQGNEVMVATAPEEINPKKRIVKREEHTDDMSFEDGYPKPAKTSAKALRKLLILFALVLGLTIIGWIVYYFFQQWQDKKNGQENTLENIQPVIPSPAQAQDSLAAGKDSLATISPVNTNGDYTYKVVIETAKRQRALNRHKDLQKMGYDVQLSTEDSITFKLYTVVTGPLSDTSRSRDSITRFFGRKARIELK
jgi:hypothetical protein